MIFNIKFETVKNIEDKIQISISQETKVGEKIVSESLAEYPNCLLYTSPSPRD